MAILWLFGQSIAKLCQFFSKVPPMRILPSVVLLTLVWIGTAAAEGASGPWGMNLGIGYQTAAVKRTLPLPQDAELAVRYLKPTVIRHQSYWCVPYARAVSGIALRGNAWTWWGGARDLYAADRRRRLARYSS